MKRKEERNVKNKRKLENEEKAMKSKAQLAKKPAMKALAAAERKLQYGKRSSESQHGSWSRKAAVANIEMASCRSEAAKKMPSSRQLQKTAAENKVRSENRKLAKKSWRNSLASGESEEAESVPVAGERKRKQQTLLRRNLHQAW